MAPPERTSREPALRVLIAAENASARFGGEAALPLHYFRILRRRGMQPWLVTHARTRGELEALFPGETRIAYIDDTIFHRAMWRIGKLLPPRLSNFTFGFLSRVSTQLEQRKLARRLVRENGVDVIHQPMPVSPREPSLLFGLGAPVVIGPMNGGMDYPRAFRGAQGIGERLLLGAGRSAAALLNALLPGKRRACALLVANARTRRALPAGVSERVIEVVENGVDMRVWQAQPVAEGKSPSIATFVFMGRLVDWKAVDLLLPAFGKARGQAPMRLWILGDGAERAALERLADSLGLPRAEGFDGPPGSVSFAGWRAQAECAQRLQAADALVLPSLLECGGAVVLEAMALGKPVIATAWGGPLDYLDDACGILVEPTSREALIDGFADAMARLASDPAKRRAMGANGRAKVEREYDWELKVDRVLGIFGDVVAEARGGSGRRPVSAR